MRNADCGFGSPAETTGNSPLTLVVGKVIQSHFSPGSTKETINDEHRGQFVKTNSPCQKHTKLKTLSRNFETRNSRNRTMKKLIAILTVIFLTIAARAEQWEYRVVHIFSITEADQLAELGKEEWELVAPRKEIEHAKAEGVLFNTFIFKRKANADRPKTGFDFSEFCFKCYLFKDASDIKKMEFGLRDGRRAIWMSKEDFNNPENKALLGLFVERNQPPVDVYELSIIRLPSDAKLGTLEPRK